MSRRRHPAWWESYGTEVPEVLGRLADRSTVTPAEFADLHGLLGDDWAAIEQHIRAHLVDRRYVRCTMLPDRLCDRWCPVGGDPDLIAAVAS